MTSDVKIARVDDGWVALHNLCIWLNEQLGRPRLAFADLLGWQSQPTPGV
jgi:hypothetical protein